MNDTLSEMVFRQVERFGDRTALRRKVEGIYQDISWSTFGERITSFGRALVARGVQPGDRVAVMAPNGPDWACADLAAMSAGAVSIPVYHTEGTDTVAHILGDSGSRLLFLFSAAIAEKLLERLDELENLELIVLLEGELDHPRATTLERFLEEGKASDGEELARRREALNETDLATIVYTSGTTGPPKGAMLSHENFLSNIRACTELFDIGTEDECLSFLPLSHVFERMGGYYLMLHQGAVIAYAESIDTVPNDLQQVRPTILISVPRLYEKMYARVMERVLSGPWLRKQLFFGALNAGRKLVAERLAGRQPGVLLRGTVAAARKVVFSKLHDHLGGRLRFFVSGGAPLDPEIAEFFLAAGLPIYEGYGLTETSPVIAANTPEALRLGTVGKPLPGTEVKIADDGEILVRGPGVFRGYWQDEERSAEAFEGEWFRTGDIGRLDDDGYLAITDRKKDLLVTAGGKNIAPQELENRLKSDKYLSAAMVCGDRRPFLTALLVPNFENLEKYARYKQIDYLNHCDLVRHPRILDLVRRRIDRLQQELPSYQHVKRFTLLSQDFSGEQLTPTLKLKRKVIREDLHQVIEEMYRPRDHGAHDSGFCVIEEETA